MKPSIKMSKRPSGFTLVELLLAITLMSILLALSYSGLRAATRSSVNGEQMLAEGGAMRAAHQFLRRQLNQMLPLPFAMAGEGEEVRVVFEGDAGRIRYVAPMPGYLGSGGPQVQVVEVARDPEGGLVLQFSHALLLGFEEDRLYDREPVLLLEDVSAADFEFLGVDEAGQPAGWTTYWEQQDVLPAAVRLNLEFEDQATLQWPALVAGVKIDELAVKGGVGQLTYQQTIRDLIKRGGRDRE